MEVDETTDVTQKAQISVILHYVAQNEADCEVKEVFLGFDDVSEDRRSPASAKCMPKSHTFFKTQGA